MSRARVLLVAAAAVTLASCDGPKGGELVAELTTSVEFGALQFVVRTTDPQTVDTVTAACTGCRAFMERVSAAEVRGVVTGSVRQGPVLRVHVSDIELPEAYQIQLIQGAKADYSLLSVSGSTLRIPVIPEGSGR